MIENIDTFITKYKKIFDRNIDVYRMEEFKTIKWNELDFDVNKLRAQMMKTDNLYLYSVLKRAYDYIRAYHRTFRIYKMSRESYYRFAEHDTTRDLKIMDRITNNLMQLKTKLENTYNITDLQEADG